MRTFRIKPLPVPAILAVFALLSGPLAQNQPAGASGTFHSASLTADQIVANMASRNEWRAAALPGYMGRRVYELHYRGLPGNRDAELIVQCATALPRKKILR